MDLNFADIFRYFMSLSPLFISSFLVLGSVLNQDVKGLVYIGFVLIVAILSIGFKQLFKVAAPAGYNPDVCQVFNLPAIVTQYSAPDFNSMVLSFTALYLIMPMAYGAAPLNALLIVVLGIFILGNGFTRVTRGCNNIMDILLGNVIGAGLGIGFFFALWAKKESRQFLFTDTTSSNNVTCNRPSKQTFKCAVYKNGQLIKNL